MIKSLYKGLTARSILVLGLVAFFAMPILHVWAAKGDLVSMGAEKKLNAPLQITLGKAELVQIPGNVADVLVADSDVVSVQAVQSDRLYLVGRSIGDTNLIALDENGDIIKKLDVHVAYDLTAIQSLVNDMFPNESVELRSIHGRMVMTGKVSTPDKAAKITNLVNHYVVELTGKEASADEIISNHLEVRGEQQVMLQVRVVEASRSFIRDFGIQTVFNDANEAAASQIFGGTRPSSVRGGGLSLSGGTGAGVALPNDPAGAFRLLSGSGIAGIGDIGVFINALEREDLVSVLAEPNLTAISGQQAGFLAGGEFPVPVGRDQVGNIVIEYREFGVSLNFRPVVLSEDRISLQLNTEVSSLDFVNAVGAGDLIVPGLDIRRAETTLEIPSGGTLMMAGLLQSDAVEGLAGLPGIRKAPILGDLISSKSFSRNETELVVLVTPYLVKPFADKSRAEELPPKQQNALAQAFAINIRNRYAKVDDAILNADQNFGYILD